MHSLDSRRPDMTVLVLGWPLKISYLSAYNGLNQISFEVQSMRFAIQSILKFRLDFQPHTFPSMSCVEGACQGAHSKCSLPEASLLA